MYVFLQEGRRSKQCFGVGPRAQFFADSFPGCLLVSGPFGLGISELLGCAWREQLSQALRHFPLGWEGN